MTSPRELLTRCRAVLVTCICETPADHTLPERSQVIARLVDQINSTLGDSQWPCDRRAPHLSREQLVAALKRISGGAYCDPTQMRTVCKQAWKMLKADGRAEDDQDASEGN